MSDTEQKEHKSGQNTQQACSEEKSVDHEGKQASAEPQGSRQRRKAARLRNQPTSVEAGTSTPNAPSNGGEESEPVPKALGLFDFANARVQELHSMMKAVKTLTGTRRISQSLPRHMRRRAVSHNCKRLPVRLRAAALKEMEKQHHGEKAPSRRHRRRPSNLREVFAQRQQRVGWLETHLWHAKRMHMKNMWGYRLAQSPCDKGRRAAFRAASRDCLMTDVSYHTCVELYGSFESICQAMEPLCHSKCGPTVKAAQYMDGQREGCLCLFKTGAFPRGALGPVRFLWKPPDCLAGPPAAKRARSSTEGLESRRLWLWVHPSYFDGVFTELNASCSACNVSVTSLKGDMCRFSLFGPKSTAVLKDVLECWQATNTPDCENASEWWQKESEWQDSAVENHVTWHKYSVFPARTVIGLVVCDPRLGLPDKRRGLSRFSSSSSAGETVELLIQDTPKTLCSSPLWSTSVRNQVKSTKISEQQFNARRAVRRANPEEMSDDSLSSSLVPVMLCRHAQGLGWDLLLPSGWSMAFWISLIYRGVHTGGQEEMKQYLLEAGLPFSPHDCIDTKSGQEYTNAQAGLLEKKHLLRPPQKRLSFPRLAVKCPFHLGWKEILSNCHAGSTSEDFFILRDNVAIRRVQQLIQAIGGKGTSRQRSAPDLQAEISACQSLLSSSDCSFVPVCVEATGRGVFRRGAMISMPSVDDLKTPVTVQSPGPVQPKVPSRFCVEVLCTGDSSKSVLVSSVEPCRTTIGFLVNGVHSLSRGKSIAVGFCSTSALLSWLSLLHTSQARLPVVLLRNRSSYQYRFAELKVITNAGL